MDWAHKRLIMAPFTVFLIMSLDVVFLLYSPSLGLGRGLAISVFMIIALISPVIGVRLAGSIFPGHKHRELDKKDHSMTEEDEERLNRIRKY